MNNSFKQLQKYPRGHLIIKIIVISWQTEAAFFCCGFISLAFFLAHDKAHTYHLVIKGL